MHALQLTSKWHWFYCVLFACNTCTDYCSLCPNDIVIHMTILSYLQFYGDCIQMGHCKWLGCLFVCFFVYIKSYAMFISRCVSRFIGWNVQWISLIGSLKMRLKKNVQLMKISNIFMPLLMLVTAKSFK